MFATGTAGVVDTNFSTGVNDNRGKFMGTISDY
jgi:hypothetical protein